MLASISHRINTFLLVLLVLMVGATIAILAQRAGAGPLDPPAPPAPTLPQVEPRMPIPPVGWNGTFPITISQPGSYYFTQNLTGVSGQNGIVVSASDVTIDLNGFELRGGVGTSNGIAYGGQFVNLAVKNGMIDYWNGTGLTADEICAGTYENLRFTYNQGGGIRAGGDSIIRNVDAFTNAGHGILLNAGTCLFDPGGGVVQACTSADNTLDGIQVLGQALVESNSSYHNGGDGIRAIGNANQVKDNAVSANGANGIEATGSGGTIAGNTASSNTNDGIHVSGSGNHIDNNHLDANANVGLYLGTVAASNPNYASRNTSDANGVLAYNVGPGNEIGPVTTLTAATNPWGNIGN